MKIGLRVLLAWVCFVQPIFPQQQGCSLSGDIGRVLLNTPGSTTGLFCAKKEDGTVAFVPIAQDSWTKFSVLKVANGTGTCASANGCWTVNGAGAQIAPAALFQYLTLLTPISDPFVHSIRLKTTTACTGTSALTISDIGTDFSRSLFATSLTYDLKAAVSVSNISFPSIAANAPTTTGSNSLVLKINSTGTNLSTVAAGCAFDVHMKLSQLPQY